MAVEVILPKVDMDMTHGTLSTWHVAVGDAVTKGAPLFDIETDKAAMEVEAPATGTLAAVTAQPGDRIAVGSVIALILAEGEVAVDTVSPVPLAQVATAQVATTQVGAPPVADPAPTEVILPKVDMDMTHGTFATWHVAEGALVQKGAALFDIETDKAAMEVEAPATGYLHHLMAKPGDKVAVGSVVAYIYAPGQAVGPVPSVAADETAAAPLTKAVAHTPASPSVLPAAGAAPVAASSANTRATPAARAAARKAGITLVDIIGTGPLGRIQRDDITALLDAPAAINSIKATTAWAPQPGPLNIRRRKGDGATYMLLHGFTADNQSWSPLEKAMGALPALIRIDMPNHGKSPNRRITSFATLARMMVEAFDEATRETGPVHIIGHSLGGALALAIADIRAPRVASLTLIAPAGLGPEIDSAVLQGIIRASRAESLAPWLRRLTASPDTITDSFAEAAMRARSDAAQRAAQADMANVIFADGTQTFDLRPALERTTIPTRIVWGRQDQIIPHRHALAAKTDAAIHLLQGAGHIPHIECAERLAAIIAR